MTEAMRIDDAKIGGTDCFRIEGKFAEDPITIWIDKMAYSVRRIDEAHEFDDFSTSETTTYEPLLDIEVADELLDLNLPK